MPHGKEKMAKMALSHLSVKTWPQAESSTTGKLGSLAATSGSLAKTERAKQCRFRAEQQHLLAELSSEKWGEKSEGKKGRKRKEKQKKA